MTPEELDAIEARTDEMEFITRHDVLALTAEVRRLNADLARFINGGAQ